MNKINRFLMLSMLLFLFLGLLGCSPESKSEDVHPRENGYYMPAEDEEHEGTWLQWPHSYTYGEEYQEQVEGIWIEMASLLSEGEMVHIITYDEYEKEYVKGLLEDEGLDTSSIDFYVYPTDDVWVRDNGPIFVYDQNEELVILDWGFNGWGDKTPYENCDKIPQKVSDDIGIKKIDLQDKMVLEGGAIELDGNGTCLAARSSVTNSNRNPNLTEKQIEEYIGKYFGVYNFIWIDGAEDPSDITDFHIDGVAKFLDSTTVVTMEEYDLLEWGTKESDIEILENLENAEGVPYEYVYLPLTTKNVVLDDGYDLGYKGSYINYYIGNDVVLVPNYNDKNDSVANGIIQELYSDREVIGIDVRELYQYGGMIHCVTQQQPL